MLFSSWGSLRERGRTISQIQFPQYVVDINEEMYWPRQIRLHGRGIQQKVAFPIISASYVWEPVVSALVIFAHLQLGAYSLVWVSSQLPASLLLDRLGLEADPTTP